MCEGTLRITRPQDFGVTKFALSLSLSLSLTEHINQVRYEQEPNALRHKHKQVTLERNPLRQKHKQVTLEPNLTH